MGREHRIPADPRLREKGDRRPARVSFALPTACARRIELDPGCAIAGIDVGERYLDLAILAPGRREITLQRIALEAIAVADAGTAGRGAIAALAARIRAEAPELGAHAIAIVDSPRWPADLDCSVAGVASRYPRHHAGRCIDARLRSIVTALRRSGAHPALTPLALFPAPGLDYFAARLKCDPSCKPHLRVLGCELFAPALAGTCGPLTGGTFTRFMLAGFATYRALEVAGIAAYEGYPDLQFRLCSTEARFPPKNGSKAGTGKRGITRAEAFAARRLILARLQRQLELDGCGKIASLDAADAAILALSCAAASRDGALVVVEASPEGRFLLAFEATDAQRLGIVRRD